MTQRANGFTLIELLVSLAIFALISVLLFGGFRFGLRAWESESDRLDRMSQVELVQTLLRRELAVAVLPRPRQPSGDLRQAPPFIGGRDTVSFIGTMPTHAEVGGNYRLTLGVNPNRGHAALMLTWMAFRPAASRGSEAEDSETDLLLDEVAGVEFSYFGLYDRNRPPDWVPEWTDPQSLPELVRMRVIFPPGDPRRWPDLVVAPRLSWRH